MASRCPSGLTLEEYFHWHMPGDPPTGGCWEWSLKPGVKGYGQVSYGGQHITAHVLSYRIHHGEPSSEVVRHTCNNPICVHPDHLLAGTYADNTQDMLQAEREARGERNGQAKLTESDVLEIRQAAKRGIFHRVLADQYGVSRRAIGHIVRGSTWAYLS
jgi:hypothetical protein